MKIIQVCTSRDQLQRGGERFCLKLSRSLATADHDVTLVTGNISTTNFSHTSFAYRTISEVQSVMIRKLGFDYINPRAIYEFKRILEDIRPDIIHFHSFYGLSTSLVKVAVRQCPVIVTIHDSWLAFIDSGIVTPRLGLSNSYLKIPLGWIHRIINKRLLRDSTLVSPSFWMKKFFETAGFNSPLHIPNGIEITNTRTTYQNTLLWVGALTTFKGLPAVIATLSDISIQTGWNIVVVGDGPHKPALESRYPNIDFVGHRDPTQFYRRASILVFSSLGYENFPTVVLEGMQYGLCVVGHNLGGTTELLQHNKTGVLYRTTESLKDNLKLLMNDPMKVRKLGNAAKEFLKTEYRWETCIQRYLNLYKMSITRQSGHK